VIGDFARTSIDQVSRFLGPPTRKAVLTCDRKEGSIPIVEWGDFVLEGRSGRFSAYVYAAGGMNALALLPNSVPYRSAVPALRTSKEITLGSTVAQLHAAYPGAKDEAIGYGSEYSRVVVTDNFDSSSSLDFTTTSDTPNGKVVAIDAGDSVYCPILLPSDTTAAS
jgi:hypothetical protein